MCHSYVIYKLYIFAFLPSRMHNAIGHAQYHLAYTMPSGMHNARDTMLQLSYNIVTPCCSSVTTL